MLDDKKKFKNENHENWLSNTGYWLSSPLRQVEDTKEFLKKKLGEILFEGCTVYDMCCGSGWLLDFIIESGVRVKYVGFDFNERFISYLTDKFSGQPDYSFVLADLENPIGETYSATADFSFNNFSFFEIANLAPAFDNAVKILKPGGSLIITTIDVSYLIVAISNTYEDFKNNLVMYEQVKAKGEIPYFFQPIDLGNAASEQLKYASVLYSLADYFKLAKSKGLILKEYDEIICMSRFIPKVYQYLEFSN